MAVHIAGHLGGCETQISRFTEIFTAVKYETKKYI